MTFKVTGFNLTEVLISFGPDFPSATVSPYSQVWGFNKQFLVTNNMLA